MPRAASFSMSLALVLLVVLVILLCCTSSSAGRQEGGTVAGQPTSQTDEAVRDTFVEEPVIRQALDTVLSGAEFERVVGVGPEPVQADGTSEPGGGDDRQSEPKPAPTGETWLQRLSDWLRRLGGGGGSSNDGRGTQSTAATLLVYLTAAMVLLAAIAFIVKSVLESSGADAITTHTPLAKGRAVAATPGELAPATYLERAQSHAARGQHKEAIRELLLGAMSFAERRGLIRHRKGLTNRDYFWAFRGPARDSLAVIAAVFERVYFGRREASHADYQKCREQYERSFGAEPTS